MRARHVVLTAVGLFLLVTLASGAIASEPASSDGPASSGVALAAIQELDKRVQAQAERIAHLEAQNAELAARLAALEPGCP